MFKLPKLPLREYFSNEKGIAPVLVLLLLLAGIAGGTFLVQQRTNIMPFAAGENLQTINRTIPGSCTNYLPEPGQVSPEYDNGYKNGCVTEFYVSSKSDNPESPSGQICNITIMERYKDGCTPTTSSAQTVTYSCFGNRIGITIKVGEKVVSVDDSVNCSINNLVCRNGSSVCLSPTDDAECKAKYNQGYSKQGSKCEISSTDDQREVLRGSTTESRGCRLSGIYNPNTGNEITLEKSEPYSGCDTKRKWVKYTCEGDGKLRVEFDPAKDVQCQGELPENLRVKCTNDHDLKCKESTGEESKCRVNVEKNTLECTPNTRDNNDCSNRKGCIYSETKGNVTACYQGLCEPGEDCSNSNSFNNGSCKYITQCTINTYSGAIGRVGNQVPCPGSIKNPAALGSHPISTQQSVAQAEAALTPETSTPSDPGICRDTSKIKTCVYVQGKDDQGKDKCFMGLCKDGKDCGFSSAECSFQNGASLSCLNTQYKHTNGNYSVEAKVGGSINCPSAPAQGGSSGSTSTEASAAGSEGSGAAGSAPAYVEPPTEREKLAERCGFATTVAGTNIPLFPIGLGENQQIQDADCQKLAQQQREYFDSYIEKARAEAEEAARNNNLVYKDGEFVIDPRFAEMANEDEKKKANQKAEELNQSLASKIKAAEQKSTECKDKTGQEAANCLKEAQKGVQSVATAAQSLAVANALAKYKQIVEGKRPGGCVKADLGITPYLEAQRLKRKPARGSGEVEDDEQRRVLLCAGDKDPKQLKWRVLVGGLATGETRVKVNADGTTTTITGDAGVDDADGCGDKDCGNDAERIYGLHGTSPDATGDPKYPYTTEGKNPVTFENPNTEEGRKVTMGKYIEAAEKGLITIRSAPKPGDTATDGSPVRVKSGGSQSGGSSSNTQDSGNRSNSEANTRSSGSANKECSSIKECLVKRGDGWICADDACVNAGSDDCTNDAYCQNKNGAGYTCASNKCARTKDTCSGDNDCPTGFVCSKLSPRGCMEPIGGVAP